MLLRNEVPRAAENPSQNARGFSPRAPLLGPSCLNLDGPRDPTQGRYFFSGQEVNPIGRFFSGGGVISSRIASNTTLN